MLHWLSRHVVMVAVDVNFSAEELASGTTTTAYYIAVGVKAKIGGQPPSFVLRTSEPRFGESGKATRTDARGTTRLSVEGVNDRGERLQMTVECGPKAP